MPADISRTLKRRYYLVERARNAAIVGILVGTLGAAGYLRAVDHVRQLAQRCACCPSHLPAPQQSTSQVVRSACIVHVSGLSGCQADHAVLTTSIGRYA